MKIEKLTGKKFVEHLLENCYPETIETKEGYVIDGHKAITAVKSKKGYTIYGTYTFPEGTTFENTFKTANKNNQPYALKIKNNNMYQSLLAKWLKLPKELRKQLYPYIEAYSIEWDIAPYNNQKKELSGYAHYIAKKYEDMLFENGYTQNNQSWFARICHIEIDDARKILDLIKQFS